jgi:hypothetical protein
MPVPPRRTYGQSYFAQARQPTLQAPQDRLLLEDAPRGPKITVPKPEGHQAATS